MLNTFFITFILLVLAIIFMGINVFFLDKKFPNTHISGQKSLLDKGITCVKSQDIAARKKVKY